MKQQFLNSPFKKATTDPPAQTTENLQVIKLLQCYIWCEHIQYSNDLKTREEGDKKTTWINTDLTQKILNCIISEKI